MQTLTSRETPMTSSIARALGGSAARAAALCALVVCSAAGRVAAADGEAATDADKANARAVGSAGVGLAVAGKCTEAIPKLTAAEKLYHAPTTAEPLGVCLIKVGRVIAGTELLNRLARETLPPNAPPAFVAAQQRAAKDYDEGVKKVARLRIHITGAPAAVQVQVDGENVDSSLLNNDRLTDPGTHSVTATAVGFTRAEAQVTLKDADAQDVALSLVADPNYQPAPLPPKPAPAGPPALEPQPPTPANRLPAYVAFGVSGVGLVVGSVFGVLALSSKSSLDGACTSAKICPASSQSNINSLHTDSIVSTIGLGAMLVGAGVGAYLFFSASPSKKEAALQSRWISVRPWIGATSFGVSGDFR
jgi:hypothetical protein